MSQPVREIFPLVVFNRPPLGQTAGQKEGIIPADHHEKSVIETTSPNVKDFRAKVVPSNVELPKAPAGDAEGPKAVDSSATDSASPSGDESSTSASTSSPLPEDTSTTTPETSPPSEPPAPTASAAKEAPETTHGLPMRTIGDVTPPVATTGTTAPETS